MLLYESLAVFLGLSTVVHGAHLTVTKTRTRASAATTTTAAASPPPEPCTIRSPHSGAFFDLKSLHILAPGAIPDKTKPKGLTRDYSWNATGWDMGYNFTMNFCGGVVENLDRFGGVVGVEKEMWRNISAFYRRDGKVYSIGQQNMSPVIRGRKLVLNYTDGSPCDSSSSRRSQHGVHDLDSRELIGGDGSSKKSGQRRKSTIISFLCEKDPLMPQLTLSFVAASQDECTYFFEARSNAACAGIEQAVQTLSPGGVFGVMAVIAFLVYVVGGCVYSRVVLQQRGWRQLPNYSLWAGLFGFFRDILIILTSTCTRCLPFGRRRSSSGANGILPHNNHYSRMSGGGGGMNGGMNGGLGGRNSGHRGRDNDAENRLIDELNEEWDD